jgi:pimeloyl-ACP methyl ester carboxylesterase
MPSADVHGQSFYYEDSGGSGPPVILGHGFLLDHTMFDPQVAALAPAFRVIRWDARGFGRTVYDGRPFTYWDAAADCIGILDHLGIERAVVGGMSQGGYAALRAALVHPDRVKALVLIGADASALGEREKANSRDMFATWESMGPVNALIKPIATMILGAPERWEPWVSQWKAIARGRLAEPARCLTERDDIAHRLPEITCPALVIHGTADSSVPIEKAEILARGLSGCAGLVQVAGAPHASNLTHPEQVNAALLAFLRTWA